MQTAPPFTAPGTETPATVGTTIAVTTTTTTTTIPVTTVAPTTTVVAGARITIFSTTRLIDEPAVTAYPVVTGNWTDRDFALVAAGANHEIAAQRRNLKPNSAAFEIWATKEITPSFLESIKQIVSKGQEYRDGTVDDFIVTSVERVDAELVVVTSCGRNNTAQYALGDPKDPNDDVLIQNTLDVFRSQWGLVRRGSRWLLSDLLELEASPCAVFFQ